MREIDLDTLIQGITRKCDEDNARIKKEKGKRDKFCKPIKDNTRQAISEALNEHFTDDFDTTFYFAPLNQKYFVTDKEVLFSVTPFLRGYSNIDLVELRQASKRISRLKKHLDLDKVKASDDKISKQILARIDEAEEEYTETKNRINQDRIIYTLTRLSEKKNTIQFYFDGISKHDFDLYKTNHGVDYEPKNKKYYEDLGYSIKRELNERTKQVFNQQTGQAETVTYPFYTFSFYINRQALITSIYKKELAKKGYTWLDDEQVKIELGRKGNKFSVITEKGERLDFDTMKDFAKNFSGTPRGLREALKKNDGKTFAFKGHHFWIVQNE